MHIIYYSNSALSAMRNIKSSHHFQEHTFLKLQVLGVNKPVIEPHLQLVDTGLPNLRSNLTNPETFSHQDNDEV